MAQGLLMPLGLFGSTEIADRITTGDVVVTLQRPHDHQAWWAAVDYGKAACYLVFRGISPFLAGALVFELQVPGSARVGAFPVSVGLAIAVAFAWRCLLQLSAAQVLGGAAGYWARRFSSSRSSSRSSSGTVVPRLA